MLFLVGNDHILRLMRVCGSKGLLCWHFIDVIDAVTVRRCVQCNVPLACVQWPGEVIEHSASVWLSCAHVSVKSIKHQMQWCIVAVTSFIRRSKSVW